jgi:hypothetical protein
MLCHSPLGASAGNVAEITTSVSPDKENEPAVSVAAPISISHSSDSTVRATGSRASTVDEREAGAEASVFLAVGGAALRRPSSTSKPPTPQPARAPSVSSSGSASSSGNSNANFRSNSRSESNPTFGKPSSSLAAPSAASAAVLRGKGWVAGVSDSLGLSLSGSGFS